MKTPGYSAGPAPSGPAPSGPAPADGTSSGRAQAGPAPAGTAGTAADGTVVAGPPVVPILFILGSCFSVQFGAALATHLFPALGSWGTTALRLGLAAVLLMAIVRPKFHRFTRQQWIAVAAFGVIVGAMNGSFYSAIDRIPLGTAVAIEFLGPLTVSAVLSTRRTDLLWVALALAGVSLFGLESFTGAGALDGIGVLFALFAAACWGLYVLASARVGKLVPGQGGLAVAMAIGALVVLPLGAPGALIGLMDPQLLALAAGTAVLGSVLPYSLELAALRRLPRHVFGILLSLGPVVALIAGVVMIGQEATLLRVAAAVFVVGASIGVTVTSHRAAHQARSGSESEAPGAADGDPAADWELPAPTQSTLTGEMPVIPDPDARVDDTPTATRAPGEDGRSGSETL
ncbi:DMT family transporter [Brachybacterium sp. GCM10030268]|uniref:EamA family transporter n=1 Tax=Brachybacterium sp. GCM10030268 TaxID=3273382 RepID=UPI00360F6653